MRKNVIASLSLAVAALAVLSCSKETELKNAPAAQDGVTIRVLSEDGATKTVAIDGDVPTIEWVNTDRVCVFEVVDGDIKGVAKSEYADIKDGKTSFSTTLNWDDAEGASYQYSAVYPAESVVEYNGAYYIIMPDTQSLQGNNFSTDSDILFSTRLDHGDTRVADGEDLLFSFRRLGTVVRLTLNGIAAGEKIYQVKVTAPVNIAGAIVYDPVTSKVDAESAFDALAYKTVTLNLDALEATGNDVVWFRVMSERDWAAGEAVSFEVITDKGSYKKEVTLPSAIKFPDGGLTKFGVGLASSKTKPVDVPCLWDFESGADDWTFIDNDGDGYNWFTYADEASHSGDYALFSQSYGSAPLYPDNWAFTPAVQLTEDNYLSFWVRAFNLNWPAEHYAVYIAKDSPYGEMTVLVPETVYPGGDYAELSDDGVYQHFAYRIPDEFANEVVCFGFRHFNCTDQLALVIDDVMVSEGSPVEESTTAYEDYLGEWAYNGGLYLAVSPKEDGVSYSISGFPGQGDYELEAKFENHRLVLYDQVAAAEDGQEVILQGLYQGSQYLEWYDFYESPRVLLRAVYDEDADALRIYPDNAYVGFVWLLYVDQAVDNYFNYWTSIPSVLEPYVPETTDYIYFTDFESGADDWTFIDADGDGYCWEPSAASGIKCRSGVAVLASASYNNNEGPLTPDNWAFTPAVRLTEDNYLSFWVTAQDQSWAAEHYAVYITDVTPALDNLGGCTVLLAEQEYPNGKPVETGEDGYQRFVVPIPSSFDGKTVFIGFRHFNCTDMFRFNLDDVGISNGAPATNGNQVSAPERKTSGLMKPGRSEAVKSPRPSFANGVSYRK